MQESIRPKKITWSLEKKKIKELREYSGNPRTLTKQQSEHLRKSLEKFGQCEPIVINPDGLIIGGHQRVRTLKKMGYKEVDVYVPDSALSEKEIQELNIRLNKNVGDWDYDVLANCFDLFDLVEWGFESSDFDIDADIESEEKSDTNEEESYEEVCEKCGSKIKK